MREPGRPRRNPGLNLREPARPRMKPGLNLREPGLNLREPVRPRRKPGLNLRESDRPKRKPSGKTGGTGSCWQEARADSEGARPSKQNAEGENGRDPGPTGRNPGLNPREPGSKIGSRVGKTGGNREVPAEIRRWIWGAPPLQQETGAKSERFQASRHEPRFRTGFRASRRETGSEPEESGGFPSRGRVRSGGIWGSQQENGCRGIPGVPA
jgi:hypothetical protein